MNHVEQLAAKAALQHMLNSSFFSICAVDRILAMTKGIPDKQDYNVLRCLHCIEFRDMDRELLKQLPALIERVLGAPSLFDLMVEPPPKLDLTTKVEEPARKGLVERFLAKARS